MTTTKRSRLPSQTNYRNGPPTSHFYAMGMHSVALMATPRTPDTRYYKQLPDSTNRLLAPYVPSGEVFHCPVDRGRPGHLSSGKYFPNMFRSFGCSYRLNHRLLVGVADIVDDPDYNLGLKKESWVPDPSRFISMHEWGAYPVKNDFDNVSVSVYRWHGSSGPAGSFRFTINGTWSVGSDIKDARGKVVAPVLFVDGHSQKYDFTASLKKSLRHTLDPTKNWMWYKPLE